MGVVLNGWAPQYFKCALTHAKLVSWTEGYAAGKTEPEPIVVDIAPEPEPEPKRSLWQRITGKR